ncbi:MAG: hypothetical protein IPM61_09390 [Chlorobi bacterium]|nr:MAG: 5'-nucleotidase domain-containing protein [Chlorobi bacterium OLB7]MBK8911526.1 hypothetical protein [Chlorobiota bacterium]MBX7215774.1 hypothetical protein [Candidatus Kapabacteria bacterium]
MTSKNHRLFQQKIFLQWGIVGVILFVAGGAICHGQGLQGETVNNGGGEQSGTFGQLQSSIGEPLSGDSVGVTPDETAWTGFWHISVDGGTAGVREEFTVGGVGGAAAPIAAYPIPFRSQLNVTVTLKRAATIRLVVYDENGSMVEQLASGRRAAGTLRALWDPERVSAGTYFIRLELDGVQVGVQQVQKTEN